MAVLYDSTIYTEPDGTRWYRLYHLNNPSSNGAFSQSDTFETGVYKDENRWFQLNLAKEWDSKEYIIKQKLTSSSTEEVGRFTQTVNCMDATYAQVANGTATWNTSTGYVNPGNDSTYNGGLFKLNNGTYICKADNMQADWWGAIGVWNTHGGGWPACKLTSNSPILTTGYIDVYVPAQGTLMVSGFPGNTIGTESNTYTLTVSSETAWTATVPQDSFATLDVLSGSAGDTTVTMTVAANRGAAREVTITFTNTEDEIPYTLSQKSWFKYGRPLEYIELDGTQWILTDYVPNLNTVAEYKMRRKGSPGQWAIYLGLYDAADTTEDKSFFLRKQRDDNTQLSFSFDVQTSNAAPVNWDNNTDHIFTLSKDGVLDGGNELISLSASEYTNTRKLCFAGKFTGREDRQAPQRIYYLTVTESDSTTADIIAALDNNDVPCLYNKTTETYLYPTWKSGSTSTSNPIVRGDVNYSFSSDKETLKFGGVGESKTITVTADNDWTVYSKPAWITVSPSTAEGSVDPVTVSITAERNDGNDFRFGTITFVDENGYAFDIAVRQGTHGEIVNIGKWIHGSTIVRKAYHGSNQIRQSMYGADMLFKRFAFSPTLRVWPQYMEFKWNGEPQTFTVTSNSAFTATCPADWVTLSTNGNIVTVTPSNNISETDPRSTTITVTANNGDIAVTKTISVTQEKVIHGYMMEANGTIRFYTTTNTGSGYKYVLRNAKMVLNGENQSHHPIVGTPNEGMRFSSQGTNQWYVGIDGDHNQLTGTDPSGVLQGDEMILSNSGLVIDGVSMGSFTKSIPANFALWIFGSYMDSSNDYGGNGSRLHALEVYDSNNTLVANWVAEPDDNEVPCFHDIVGDTRVYASGTGTGTLIEM